MPSNTSSGTATVISALPYSIAVSGATVDLWWKYTVPSGKDAISAWPWGGAANTGYQPTVHVYDDVLAAYPNTNASPDPNLPYQFAPIAGNTYYFKVSPNGILAIADLTFTITAHAPVDAQPGDVLICDDTFGFPLVIYNPAPNYTVRRFVRDFPAGEQADAFDNGNTLWEDGTTAEVKLYDNTWNLLVTIPDFSGIGTYVIRRCLGSGRIFVGTAQKAPAALVKIVADDGSIVSTETLTGYTTLGSLAAFNDESVLLHASDAAGSAIRQWDLVSHSALADFAAGVSNHGVTDILVMTDGTVIAKYSKSTSVADYFVRHFAADGTILATLTAQDLSASGRIGYGLEDNTFIVYAILGTGLGTGESRFSTYDADGSLVDSFVGMQFTAGGCAGAQSATPPAMFGQSNSCPVVVLRGEPVAAVPIDDSVPCCPCDCPPAPSPTGSPSSAPIPTHTGPILPPVNTLPSSGEPTPLDPSYWERLCAGAGTVPTAADPTDAENWVRV